MDEKRKQTLVSDAKGLAKWFSVSVTIKIFGHVVWSWTFPPEEKA